MGNVIEVLGKEKIKLRSRDLMKQSLHPELIDMVESLDYKLYVHDLMWGSPLTNVCTIILISHGNNVNYFKQAIESVLKQTSKNFELILVDHGCEPRLSNLINEYFIANNKIKLLTFKENILDLFAASFIDSRFTHVLNAALFCSEGDYVYFLSYDDFLSENYIECMVNLFLENENCMTATPAITSVNEASDINMARTESLSQHNLRPRYINGVDLATSVINNQKLWSAPGGASCYRTNLVLANGGLDWWNDLSQIFKFGVLGDVGTSTEAFLYWRHHEGQTNKEGMKLGAIYYGIYGTWARHIERFYTVKKLPRSYQNIFHQYFRTYRHKHIIHCIRCSTRTGWKGSFNVFMQIVSSAPKIYIAHFVLLLLYGQCILLYNSLPASFKKRYRQLKYILNLG